MIKTNKDKTKRQHWSCNIELLVKLKVKHLLFLLSWKNTKFLVAGFSTLKKWTPLNLRFCKNEGAKRSKINEKGGQLDWISRRKFIQNAWYKKLLNNTFWWKIRPTLGPSISGTKCDRDKPNFTAERGHQSNCVEV